MSNAPHRVAEISHGGALTRRQYRLGGGGQASSYFTEPYWGDYCQPDCSGSMPPFTRGSARFDQFVTSLTGGSDLNSHIEADLNKLVQQIRKKQPVSTEVMRQIKNNYSAFNRSPEETCSRKYLLPESWWILLSPQMFHQFGENLKYWESIMKKSASNMADHWDDSFAWLINDHRKQLCKLMQEKEIDVNHLNWLCDLYYCLPTFLKYALLGILQMFSGRCDSCQLQNRVKFMLASYPLSPEKLNIGTDEKVNREIGLSKCYINLVKTMTMSRSLMNRLEQHQIQRQLHHQPVGNSIIIPEKLMSGAAAFLNVSKSTSYRPIIFDCTSLAKREVNDRVVMRLTSGIKSGIAETFDGERLNEIIEKLFFYWLAAHHMNETVPPIWLEKEYRRYSETAQPFGYHHLLAYNSQVKALAQLKLPPERIKDYFNQPSALVLQRDDLLVLLDEYLSLIAT